MSQINPHPLCQACKIGRLVPKPSEADCFYLQCSHCRINMATPDRATKQFRRFLERKGRQVV